MSPSRSRYEVVRSRAAQPPLLWPMDLALVVISGLILVIVCRYFRWDDSRFWYNAWTYVLGVPSIVIALSMLFHLTAGRFVERTLQLSFLASVVVHLLLLVGTLNVVLFATYWPDVFQAVTFEEVPQKRIVAEFHQPTVAATRKRPDYLKPVPTESESEERSSPRARREHIAELQQVELPAEKETRKTDEPYLIPKSEPMPAPPMPTSTPLEIVRREMPPDLPWKSQAIEIDQPKEDAVKPNVLDAREGSMSRPRELEKTKSLGSTTIADQLPSIANSRPIVPRSRADLLPEVQSKDERRLPRKSPVEPDERLSKIAIPSQALVAEPSDRNQDLVESRSERKPPRSPSSSLEDRSTPTETPTLSSLAPSRMLAKRSRSNTLAIPGDIEDQPTRRIAGGSVAETSFAHPILEGPKSIESHSNEREAQAPSDLQANERSSQRRRTKTEVVDSSLSSPLRSPESSTSPANSNRDGKVPEGLSLAKSSLEGFAQEPDVANLAGAQGEIARSRLSDRSQQGAAISPPIEIPAGASEDSSVEDRAVDSRRSDLARSSSRTSDLIGPTGSVPVESTDGALAIASVSLGAPALAKGDDEAILRALESGSANEFSAQKGRPDALSHEGLAVGSLGGPIAIREVPIPEEAGQGRGGVEDLFGPEPSERFAKTASNIRGVGGISELMPTMKDLGFDDSSKSAISTERAIRSQRSEPKSNVPEVRVADVQTQRFRRKDLGGPTLSGSSVPVPTPAFQQRLDRNRDANSSDNMGALGPEVEQTIERGLAFLAAHQRDDGSWHLEDFDSDVLIRSDTAATALAILSFQGAGYTHQQDKYAEQVSKGLQFLMRIQRVDGDLYLRMDKDSDVNAWLYSHSIGALALSEAFGMTQDPLLREPAQKAIDFLGRSQDKIGGGWRYVPGVGSDTSVTGWCMMALKSAQLAGLDVQPAIFRPIQKWLDNSQASPQLKHLYRYNWKAPDTRTQRHGREVTPIMTSIGLLMRLYFGWHREEPAMQEGAKYLLKYLPSQGTPESPLRDTYYWYYATQVMFHMGGDIWKQWNDHLRPLLVESQIQEGRYAGSWDPIGSVPDAWGTFGGRLYVTTLNLLSLEVHYRHLPLYEATAN